MVNFRSGQGDVRWRSAVTKAMAARRHWRLLTRAAAALASARLALAVRRFDRAISSGAVPVCRNATWGVADVVWAVDAIARRVPFRAMCIEQGIAAQRLLRQSGHDAHLHYGARGDEADAVLRAHVWVSVGHRVVLGEAHAPGFAEIAVYP